MLSFSLIIASDILCDYCNSGNLGLGRSFYVASTGLQMLIEILVFHYIYIQGDPRMNCSSDEVVETFNSWSMLERGVSTSTSTSTPR